MLAIPLLMPRMRVLLPGAMIAPRRRGQDARGAPGAGAPDLSPGNPASRASYATRALRDRRRRRTDAGPTPNAGLADRRESNRAWLLHAPQAVTAPAPPLCSATGSAGVLKSGQRTYFRVARIRQSGRGVPHRPARGRGALAKRLLERQSSAVDLEPAEVVMAARGVADSPTSGVISFRAYPRRFRWLRSSWSDPMVSGQLVGLSCWRRL